VYTSGWCQASCCVPQQSGYRRWPRSPRTGKLQSINAQVASGWKVSMKPGDCNHSHIPKALEHPTGLPNPQLSHEPPAPGPLQAPVTLKPDGLKKEGKKLLKRGGGIGRKRREPLNYYNSTHNATLTEQRTHCKHMGRRRTYWPRIPLGNVSPRAPTAMWLL